jgi:hypothetical protein
LDFPIAFRITGELNNPQFSEINLQKVKQLWGPGKEQLICESGTNP